MPALQSKIIIITTVAANQRLVVEHVSGYCAGMLGTVSLYEISNVGTYYQSLPGEFANGTNLPASTPIRFYVDPGATVGFDINSLSNAQYTCGLDVSG